MKTYSAKYARQHFADVINEVHFGLKDILITRSGKPVVVITSSKKFASKNVKKTAR